MPKKFHKYKILLDENMHPRQSFPLLNSRFDVKHITKDLKKSGIKDREVYQEAVNQQRLIVTFNGDDFKEFAVMSTKSGVVSVSDNATIEQIDKKLTSFLLRNNPKALFGKFTSLTNRF